MKGSRNQKPEESIILINNLKRIVKPSTLSRGTDKYLKLAKGTCASAMDKW